MSEKRVTKVLLSQLEDVLEERDGDDRRKRDRGLPAHVNEDRRKGDRRAASKDEKPKA
ncbi:hypothetical protein [Cellvibrio japonicus]|uniref:Uncharacterized protein n=1 Tax=Cellvibrio japonicus (strain Ueda107) TaxID=498211 RepID=B3PEM6_CELJU|nr:hypothetical protein [Cellvibrio japonicus]ACE85129.1 hypothetical protein CJA_0005 [Cellvibrio japonicus Ueda107]